MFPSSGYFRGVSCPFFASGLCERPYCHFRHSRTESERSSKTENGPSYSTSNTVYQINTTSLLKAVSTSVTKDSTSETSSSFGDCSASGLVLPQAPKEIHGASNSFESTTAEVNDKGPYDLNYSLSIPSFSSTDLTLPESEVELPASVELLPQISGLPKARKTLPSYVPTPKTLGSLLAKDCAPSYTPTPKNVSDVVVYKSGRVTEYDPIKNYALNENKKSPEQEEAAFSSDEDSEATKPPASDKNSPKTGTNVKNGKCLPLTAEDDLTDSDEDVGWQASAETSSKVRKESSNYSDLLTPSSFFTEKHTTVSSDKSKENSSKISSKQSVPSDKDRTDETSSKRSDSKHYDKKRDVQRSSSTKSASLSSKSSSSSTHKSSSSSSSLRKEKGRSDEKKSSTSSHSSVRRSRSISTSSHSDPQKSKSSSQRHKPSNESSSLTSSSSSHTEMKSSSLMSSSSLSSSSSKHNKTSSSSHKISKQHTKNIKNTSSKKPEEKSPQPSVTVSDKPHSSSSEKENKHSSNSHQSSQKSHSVSRSLSSSSSSSTSSKHRSSQHVHRKSLDTKLKTENSEHTIISDKKSALISSGDDKKPSLITEKDYKHKIKNKELSLKCSEITNLKSEKKEKDTKTSTKATSSQFKSSKSTANKEISSSSSNHHGQDKKHMPNKHDKDGNASDSDIEIIEPSPPTVYNVSDSDDNDTNDVIKEGDGEKSSDSDMDFSFQGEVDLLSDSDTFDECLRIFQESERHMAEKLKQGHEKVCPDKRKAQEEQSQESFESSEDLLVSVGKKRMAHKNSDKVSRSHKSVAAMKPRLSPAQVMHNRIIEMQKRALLRAAKREGRESELPSMIGSDRKTTTTTTTSTTAITVMGGGLPVATSSLSRSIRSNNSGISSSATKVGLSPSILPPSGQRKRQAHTPSDALFTDNKPSASKTAANGTGTGTKPGPFALTPGSFYGKKMPPSSGVSKTVTVAGTASKTEKRKAHEPTLSNLKRPLIPAEFGSKVPTNVRQRYLNLMIDEHFKFRPELEAFKKGEEDEKAVYEKATNKNIYLRVAVNTIKRIRTEAAQFLPSSSKKPCLNGASSRLGGHATQSHAATLGGPNAVRQSYTLNRSKSAAVPASTKIEGKEFYNRLKAYILTEDQLKENGYPRPAEDGSSKVQFFKEEDNGESLKENERICRRCGKRFNVTKDGEPISNGLCVYHYGNAYKKRVSGAIESRYGCCNEKAGTKGCQVATNHVHERNKVDNRSGYMKTMTASSSSDKNVKVYALDCEMVYTKAGLELARVTVVGEDCQVVYESLVKPDTDIIDFNTRFSGIKAADMEGVTTDIRGVQAVMLSMISDKTILMGHSLESDLVALKLVHNTVVDTSLVFPHRLGLPYKRALRNLMLDHLQKIIQASDGGHDSKEDAVACMQLMMYKVKEDMKKEYRRF